MLNYLDLLKKQPNKEELFKESAIVKDPGVLFREAEEKDEELDLVDGTDGGDDGGLDFGGDDGGLFDDTSADVPPEEDPVVVSDLAYDEDVLTSTAKSVRIEYIREKMKDEEIKVHSLIERFEALPSNFKNIVEKQLSDLNILYDNIYNYNTNLSKYPANEIFRKLIIIRDIEATIRKEMYLLLNIPDDSDGYDIKIKM